eukprot:1149254-Pelagomonas_calceolata.AAC.12
MVVVVVVVVVVRRCVEGGLSRRVVRLLGGWAVCREERTGLVLLEQMPQAYMSKRLQLDCRTCLCISFFMDECQGFGLQIALRPTPQAFVHCRESCKRAEGGELCNGRGRPAVQRGFGNLMGGVGSSPKSASAIPPSQTRPALPVEAPSSTFLCSALILLCQWQPCSTL